MDSELGTAETRLEAPEMLDCVPVVAAEVVCELTVEVTVVDAPRERRILAFPGQSR